MDTFVHETQAIVCEIFLHAHATIIDKIYFGLGKHA